MRIIEKNLHRKRGKEANVRKHPAYHQEFIVMLNRKHVQ
jgi:hypothetical protein